MITFSSAAQTPFDAFLHKVHQGKPRPQGPFKGRLLALDPGETTGWSVWDSHDNATHYEMIACGQLPCWNKDYPHDAIRPCVANFPTLLSQYEPDRAILESYRVYEWKTESHAWSQVPTLRIIGSMETRLIDASIPYGFQTAQIAKNFVTDPLLKTFGFYQRGQRHSRDSMRHAIYFILFGTPPSQQ